MAKKTRASKRITLKSRIKQQQAVQLRMAGATLNQIASELGYASDSGAYKAIMRELEQTAHDQSESTEAVRQLEIKRLDSMLFPIWNSVLTGDLQATTTALRIQERRASLLGLDAPKQVDARIRVEYVSWNQAIKDFLDIYRELHGSAPEVPQMLSRIDALAEERFAGVVNG